MEEAIVGAVFGRAYEGREDADVDDGVTPFVLGGGRVRLSLFKVDGEYWAVEVGNAGGSLVVDEDGESRIGFVAAWCGGGGGGGRPFRPFERYVVEVGPLGW